MNNQRRKIIAKSLEKLRNVSSQLAEVKAAEEQSLKLTPPTDDFDDKRDAIEAIIDGLDDIISSVEDSINSLEATDF